VAPMAEAAVVAFLMRLLTVVGDVLFFFFSGQIANAGLKLITRRRQGDTTRPAEPTLADGVSPPLETAAMVTDGLDKT